MMTWKGKMTLEQSWQSEKMKHSLKIIKEKEPILLLEGGFKHFH